MDQWIGRLVYRNPFSVILEVRILYGWTNEKILRLLYYWKQYETQHQRRQNILYMIQQSMDTIQNTPYQWEHRIRSQALRQQQQQIEVENESNIDSDTETDCLDYLHIIDDGEEEEMDDMENEVTILEDEFIEGTQDIWTITTTTDMETPMDVIELEQNENPTLLE